jgi:hypothetical protein
MDGKEHGESCASREQERRAHPRYAVDEDSVLMLVDHGLPIKARIVDLSLEGCRLSTSSRFPGHTGRHVEITFKVKGYAFRCSGVVQWSDGHHLVGIHFQNMISRRKAELMEVLGELAAAVAAQTQAAHQTAAKPETPQPALPKSTQTLQAKPAATEVVKAGKPPTVEKTLEPPARATDAKTMAPAKMEPPTPRPAKSRDRRAQARHEVDTSATIFLVKSASALRGRVLDLSPSGCRIRTDERFPVGIYTRAETEFYLQGLPFRLGGVIQAIHDRFTVGIRFLDLSERKRQQVLDLIDEIEEMRAAEPHGEESPSEE